jgi:hypothetical protein
MIYFPDVQMPVFVDLLVLNNFLITSVPALNPPPPQSFLPVSETSGIPALHDGEDSNRRLLGCDAG